MAHWHHLNSATATGLRFVNWEHHDHGEEARADPPVGPTIAAYRCMERWLRNEGEERDNILVLTSQVAWSWPGQQTAKWQAL